MKSEAQWRKEDDAHTLARAEEIKADKARFAGAQQAAQQMIEEQKQRVNSLAKVAGGGETQKKMQKSDGFSGLVDLSGHPYLGAGK